MGEAPAPTCGVPIPFSFSGGVPTTLITSIIMTDPAAVQRSPKYYDIVAAAQVLFGEVGYYKTGVREIAERAHIALGTLYSQFPDGKIGVLSAAMTERVERLMDHISRI